MRYGYQHAAFHALKAVALFGLFLAASIGVFGTLAFMETSASMTAEELEEISILFELAGYGLFAVLTWALIEFMAAVWSISYVRRAAGWVRFRIAEVAD